MADNFKRVKSIKHYETKTPEEIVAAADKNKNTNPEYAQQLYQLARNKEAAEASASARARTFAQGASFGFADEIEAAARSLFDDRDYTDIRDDIRSQNKAYRDANVAEALALETAGAFAIPGLGTSFGLARALPAMSKAGRLGTMAGVGSIEGGVAGIGASEADTFGGVMRDAAFPAAAGAVLTPAFAAAAPTTVNLLHKGVDELFLTPQKQADRLVTETIGSDEIRPDMGPEAMLMDRSDALRTQAARYASADRKAESMMMAPLKERASGALARIEEEIVDATGFPLGTYRDALRDAESILSKNANQWYKDVNAVEIKPTDAMMFDITSDKLAPYAKDARAQYELERRKPKPRHTSGENKGKVKQMSTAQWVRETKPDLEFWRMYAGVIADAEAKTINQAKAITNETRVLTAARNRTKQDLYAQSPEYKNADLAYIDAQEKLSGARQGERVMRLNPQELADAERGLLRNEATGVAEEMSDTAKEWFRRGAGQAYRDDLGKVATAGGNYGGRLSGTEEKARKLGVGSLDPEASEKLANKIDAEREFALTKQRVDLGAGSPTAQRVGTVQDLPTKRGFVTAFMDALGGEISEDVAQKVAERMISKMTEREIVEFVAKRTLPPRLYPTARGLAIGQGLGQGFFNSLFVPQVVTQQE